MQTDTQTGKGPNSPVRTVRLSPRARNLLLGLIGACLVIVLTGIGFELSLPSVHDAKARVRAMAQSHHAQLLSLPLPTRLAESVVAVEDEHFYSNVFVDVFDGIARAAVASVRRAGDPGGSTIAQQLAKQLYPQGGGFFGTLREVGLGIKLSFVYPKREILNMYLNTVDYGNGYWGDFSAAKGYFGVKPDRLTWAEATLLAGLIQGPSVYNPRHHYGLAKARQHHVIDQLVDNHLLTDAHGSAVYRQALPLKRS